MRRNRFILWCGLAVIFVLGFVAAHAAHAQQNATTASAEKKPVRTDEPAPQVGNQVWTDAHAALTEKARRGNIDLYFLGDSITRRWEATHRENWDKNFSGWRAADFGSGGDQTQNVLYRIENGELEGVNPKVVVLLIGTNNIGFEPVAGSDERLVADVVKGVAACVNTVRTKAPQAKILVIGITPRNTNGTTVLMPTIGKINAQLAKLADGKSIRFLNINDKLADRSGKLIPGMTDDGLHLTDEGYQVWADAMRPTLEEWLGPRAAAGGPSIPK